MKIISINNKNISLLKHFIDKMGEVKKSFRYFDNRSIDVIKNHLATFMLLDEYDLALGYGHLDKENENVWLGICLLPEYKGMGYGNKMMEALIESAKIQKIKSVLLTVDRGNFIAIKMYEKFYFRLIQEFESYLKYELVIKYS